MITGASVSGPPVITGELPIVPVGGENASQFNSPHSNVAPQVGADFTGTGTGVNEPHNSGVIPVYDKKILNKNYNNSLFYSRVSGQPLSFTEVHNISMPFLTRAGTGLLRHLKILTNPNALLPSSSLPPPLSTFPL